MPENASGIPDILVFRPVFLCSWCMTPGRVFASDKAPARAAVARLSDVGVVCVTKFRHRRLALTQRALGFGRPWGKERNQAQDMHRAIRRVLGASDCEQPTGQGGLR
jgi:hypothetical protein